MIVVSSNCFHLGNEQTYYNQNIVIKNVQNSQSYERYMSEVCTLSGIKRVLICALNNSYQKRHLSGTATTVTAFFHEIHNYARRLEVEKKKEPVCNGDSCNFELCFCFGAFCSLNSPMGA